MANDSHWNTVGDALFKCLDGKPKGQQVFSATTMSAVAKGLKTGLRTHQVANALREAHREGKINLCEEAGNITIERR